MKTILIYLFAGIIVTAIVELRLTLLNKTMDWKSRLITILLYPTTLFMLFMKSRDGEIITGYLFALWVLYNIIITL
jgi:hypothetical protein